MMTFYAAAGSYQIRSEDGKNMPYIMRLGKLQPVSIPEFSLWSMLLWDVLTYEELRKKFYDKMEETEIEPSSFDKSLEMLVKRKLIIKGVGYTGADALYNMLSDTYVIPLRGVQGTSSGITIFGRENSSYRLPTSILAAVTAAVRSAPNRDGRTRRYV